MAVSRLERQEEFCNQHGWGNAELYPLASDASFRTYTRLVDGDRKAMLMDAPPEEEDLGAYLKIATHLTSLGLRAPKVYAYDLSCGFALIEDFGNNTFTNLLAAGAPEPDLYMLATDVLIGLHQAPKAAGVDVPPYNEERLLTEVSLLTDWFVPAARSTGVSENEKQEYLKAWSVALHGVSNDRPALVLRDFHVDNLMVLEGAVDVKSCGLLDFQDALIGSPAYDMVSLLEDARRDVTDVTRRMVLDKYFAALPHVDQAAFMKDMVILGAQRHAKVAGIFMRLSRRDDKHVYLHHIPRVLQMLERCLKHSELVGVRDVIERMVPEYTAVELSVP